MKTNRQLSLGRRMVANWQLLALLAPGFIYLLIFSYQPMYGLVIAFKDFRAVKGILGSPWVGLKHFIRFVNYPNFWLYIENTVLISLYSIATFPCSLIFALLINELNSKKFKRVVQMVSYAPHFISTVVLCGMLFIFFNKETGIINLLVKMLGGEARDYMIMPGAFRHIYTWSGVWQNLGWGTIIYLAALSGVSPELHEAAYLDGASRLQIIMHVNIPCILPTIVILFVMNFGSIMSVGFEKIYLLQTPLNLSVSQVISTYVYEIGLVSAQFSYSTAIGLFNTIINVVLLIMVNQIARKITSISLW